jgi:hypothetical protein
VPREVVWHVHGGATRRRNRLSDEWLPLSR